MTKFFYARLAISNIKKNHRTYVPFILTCILTIAMYYIMKSLSLNPDIENMVGSEMIAYIMMLGSWVVALFSVIFLFYTNSFLVKKRKKEFGVFNILGMEKRHLSRVLAWETVYVMLISLAAGLGFGIALDKAMFLLIGKVLGADVILGFFISVEALASTCILFAVIFVIMLGNAVCQIQVSNPVELLRAGNTGEKEPKTKWLLAFAGAVCLGAGYYLSATTKDPVSSIFVFFIAVVLVIIGTYMLFTAGSIAFLKLLRKNKRYYYKTKHFTSIAGMIYRMKQNAVGLANICILSTMVLVMVSSTTCLMVGMEDIIKARYPHDFSVYFQQEESEGAIDVIQSFQKERKFPVSYEQQYQFLEFAAFGEGDSFSVVNDSNLAAVQTITTLVFVTLSDFNAVTGNHKTLEEGEIFVYPCRETYDASVLQLFGKEYQVAEILDTFIGNGSQAANMSGYYGIVVPDLDEMKRIGQEQSKVNSEWPAKIRMLYEFDSDASSDQKNAFYDELMGIYEQHGFSIYMESREQSKISFISLYGGLFFIGVFLGILFLMATVLIIYYKQISEGYDDKERFTIMQNVGMSHAEVRSSIHSQVLTVFFLPLLMAGIHLLAAFPLISELLALMNFVNTRLYILCTMSSFFVFAVLYVLIYLITARTYYRIVSTKQ